MFLFLANSVKICIAKFIATVTLMTILPLISRNIYMRMYLVYLYTVCLSILEIVLDLDLVLFLFVFLFLFLFLSFSFPFSMSVPGLSKAT